MNVISASSRSVDPADAAETREGLRARGDELGLSGAGEQRHHHEDLPGADGQIHGASYGGDGPGFAGVPIGQVVAFSYD